MLIDRTHRGWAFFTVVATVLLALLFIARYYPALLPFPIDLPPWLGSGAGVGSKPGATPVGLSYGAAAFLIFLFAAALGLRKKVPLWRLGSAKFWLKGHIWLTILSIPLIIMHADFRAGAPITFWLLVIYAIVMLSGFYGLALQQFLPRLMKQQLPLETIYEQIPYLKKRLADIAVETREKLLKEKAKLQEESDKAAKAAEDALNEAAMKAAMMAIKGTTASEEAAQVPVVVDAAEPDMDLHKMRESITALVDALEKEILPYLMVRKTEHLLLSKQGYSDQVFRGLKLATVAEHRLLAEQMESWCDERRSMDLQTRFQHWLHAWLLVHVPMSYILIAFTAWHAVVALFNY